MWSVEKIVGEYGIDLPERIQGIVDGKPCPNPDAPYLMPAVCPATEEVYSHLEESGAAQVDAAVTSARRAFDAGDWSGLPHLERKKIILQARDALSTHADELAAIQAMEVGLPIGSVQGMHVPRTMENFEFFLRSRRNDGRGDIQSNRGLPQHHHAGAGWCCGHHRALECADDSVVDENGRRACAGQHRGRKRI